jgi:hypothetical protein
MKKTVLIMTAFMLTITTFSQSEKYIKAMEKIVPAVDTTWDTGKFNELSNSFQRIADAEKTQWLPYYYAALCNVLSVYAAEGGANGMGTAADPIATKAEELLNKADVLSKDNSEIYCVKKMIASLRLMVDPMNRYMTYGPAAGQALAKAKQLNPENPRVFLLEGQDKYYTPEEYGGSKTEGKKLFEEAKKKYEAFKPESSIHPVWGKNQVDYFLSQG